MRQSDKPIFASCIVKVALATFLILSLVVLSLSITLPQLERFLVVHKPLGHADALVVMAGETAVRLPAAAKLYKEGKADKILLTNDGIFSSWSEEKQRNLYEVELAEDKLLKLGIPGTSIVKLTYSASGSIFDALNTRKYVMVNNIKSLIVVTSDYHTRRSLWIFERVFRGLPVTIGVYPAGEIRTSSLPKKFYIVSLEMIKALYYHLAYGNI